MRNLFKDGLNQMWFNAQKMETSEREAVITKIIYINKSYSWFIDYHAKYLLAVMISSTECYYNGLGYQTKVKEFDKLGWYDEKGNLDFNKIME